jgi:hypothetical protein
VYLKQFGFEYEEDEWKYLNKTFIIFTEKYQWN